MTRRRTLATLLGLSRLLLLALALVLGCKSSPSLPAPSGSASPAAPLTASAALQLAPAKPYPTSVAEAGTLRASGASWTNAEIRVYYNKLVDTIGPSNERWKQEGLPLETRAHRAFDLRHDARLTCRAMMADPGDVEDLRKRDQAKYGSPDGPTFEHLVEKAKEGGKVGDAVYEGILASAQRTDEGMNAVFGIKRSP